MNYQSPAQLESRRAELLQLSQRIRSEVRVCCGTGCAAMGSMKLHEAFCAEARAAGIDISVALTDCAHSEVSTRCVITGCQGLCQAGPLVTIVPENIVYCGVRPSQVAEIVTRTLQHGEVIEQLLYRSPTGDGKRYRGRDTIPFYAGQRFVALEGCGHVVPDCLDAYIHAGGFKGLLRALEMTPDEIIREVERSGLRGRGGGGFPTGRKWRIAAESPSDLRYVVCNGDEGDPGAFMDCSIMEGDPFRVLEGMMIASLATGATQGFIYVRNEYPRAVIRLQQAIDACRNVGLLGEGILGSTLSLQLSIVRGGGAFVCGESTALMRSIEGKVGEPRAKYVRSVVKGLHDKPTVLNNVETFACASSILSKGADWFSEIGTSGSRGTKAFCIVGKVVNTGLIEIPMGTSLRTVIFEIGGGMLDGRPFKAVQTGGPSGGCLSVEHLDLPVDFDALTRAGSMMGSGGMIVMDDRTCMVDVARYYLGFLKSESCGKCVPCREGVRQLYEIVERITRGEGRTDDLDRIQRLGEDVATASLCGLGKSAPNPLLSAITGFKKEFEEHIHNGFCAAGVCRELTRFTVAADKCTGCVLCKRACPVSAISGKPKEVHVIDVEKCTGCGACRAVCRFDAVQSVSRGVSCRS